MLHVLQYGTRLAEEKKKVNNSDFRPFQVCHFKVAPIHIANTTAGWGKLYKRLNVFLNMSICSLALAMILNTLIGAAILFSGHLYIWLCYCKSIFSMFKVAFVPLAHV